MNKTIKSSERGLTFSFTPTNSLSPGCRYDYTINGNEIVISPSVNGKMTVSRKKSGSLFKSLVDIRASSVVNKIKHCDHIELEILDDVIIAHICKAISISRNKIVDISQVLQCSETETIVIPKAAVGDGFTQLSFFEDNSNYFRKFSNEINQVFTVLSLFSGAGMLDYPFAKDDRFNIILANDIGSGQVESYKKNIGEVIIQKDIRELKIIPKCDVVLGGPSCKPFSNVNRNTRLEDHPDYFLIEDYIRIVKQANPKVFVIENVPTFISTAEGMFLDNIISKLSEYEFTVKQLIDCECGGYTMRKRVIVIGSRIGKVYLNNIKSDSYKTVKDALDKVDATWFNYNDFTHSRPETQKRMAYVQNGHNWTDVPESLRKKSRFADFMRRITPDKPAPAIVNVRKACIMPPKEYLKGEERTLSVAECSALMGFPKEFIYLGTLDERQQQVANGVTFKIAEIIKNAVLNILQKRSTLGGSLCV